MNLYTAFGLQIASEPELTGLLPGCGDPQVTIRYGSVPEILPEPIVDKGVLYQINKDSFLVIVPGIGRFLAKEGKELIIEKFEGATETDLSWFTINTPIGALLYQRGYLPLHASAVLIDDTCVVFTGVSGVGKSTILASFQQHGFQVLADEICAISLSGEGIPMVQPGVAYTYLWRDVLDHLGKDVSQLKHRENNPEKFKVTLEDGFCNQSFPLKRVYILSTKNNQDLEIVEIRGQEKFLPIKQNAYRARIGNSITNSVDAFKMFAGIGKHTIVKRIYRPDGKRNIDALRELVLKDVRNL